MKEVADLEPDDKVMVHRRSTGSRLAIVARTTKTQVILADGDRFSRKNGEKVGEPRDAWRLPTRITPATDKDLREYKRRALRVGLRKLGFDISNADTEDEILQLVEDMAPLVAALKEAQREDNIA